MLQVSPDSVVLAACCAGAPRFINVNPVISVMIKVKVFWRFLLPRQPRPGQTNSEFWVSLVEIIGRTLDVEVKFKSRKKCPN